MSATRSREVPPVREVLRGGSLVTAPFTLVGAVALAVCVAIAVWMAWGEHPIGEAAWATVAVAGVVAAAAFVAARGCRVLVREGEVVDQVAWRTVHRVRRRHLVAVRVRRGPWRVFEEELEDGTRRVLLGAGPQQFPAFLSGQAREHDLRTIERLMGPDEPTEGSSGGRGAEQGTRR